MPSSIRNYNSITTSKSLGSELLAATSYLMLAEGDTIEDFPPVPFTLVIEPGVEGKEEIVTVTEITGLQLTISRGEEGLGASQHNAGSEVRHMATGRDFQNFRDHIDATENVHGLSDVTTLVTLNGNQTITNKTLTGNTISGSSNSITNIPQSSVSSLETDLAAKASSSDLTTHTSASTSVHGIADTSKLAKVASASAGRTIFVQASTPTALATGDIWFQVTGL